MSLVLCVQVPFVFIDASHDPVFHMKRPYLKFDESLKAEKGWEDWAMPPLLLRCDTQYLFGTMNEPHAALGLYQWLGYARYAVPVLQDRCRDCGRSTGAY